MPVEQLSPGDTIGVLGGGQLGRLLAVAGSKLGLKISVYAPEAESPAFQTASNHWQASYDHGPALSEFARACNVVTFEFENVPAETLKLVETHTPVFPPPQSAAITQNRMAERLFLVGLGLPVAPYIFLQTMADLIHAASLLDRGPAILKRATQGYDGKGQAKVTSHNDLENAFAEFNSPCVLEAKLEFETEISVICARSKTGDIRCYDVPRNTHKNGILIESTVPSGLDEAVERQAQAMAAQIANALNYVGILGVEFFVMPEGQTQRLVVNEIAPRVHNTGHWTLDACTINQFENHIRAVAGWPLGSTERHSNARMRNLLGNEIKDWQKLIELNRSASLYLYGKSDIRSGRKLGHVTQISPIKKNED